MHTIIVYTHALTRDAFTVGRQVGQGQGPLHPVILWPVVISVTHRHTRSINWASITCASARSTGQHCSQSPICAHRLRTDLPIASIVRAYQSCTCHCHGFHTHRCWFGWQSDQLMRHHQRAGNAAWLPTPSTAPAAYRTRFPISRATTPATSSWPWDAPAPCSSWPTSSPPFPASRPSAWATRGGPSSFAPAPTTPLSTSSSPNSTTSFHCTPRAPHPCTPSTS